MATAAPRRSLDPPSLVDHLPHALHNPLARAADLALATHSQIRRVSSDSQAPSSPRVTRRMPVPILLEAFPAPPSHIPGTPTSAPLNSFLSSPSPLASATSWSVSAPVAPPATTNAVCPSNSNPMSPCSPKSIMVSLPHSNPPPSLPPTGPLPPIPGPSTVSADLLTTQRASPAATGAESQRPRLSIDVNEPARGRGRQGSLSSLRNPRYPVGRQSEAIGEDFVQGSRPPPPPPAPPPSVPLPALPILGSAAERKSHDISPGNSPDILRSSLPRVAAAPPIGSDNKLEAEDSIANVDMSDLNALKSDNEGEADEASRPFPRFPPLPRSQPQSPSDLPSSSVPSHVHPPRKPRASSLHPMSGPGASESASAEQRAMSPEITQMITATPRPRKRSMPSRSRDASSTRSRKESSKCQSGGDMPAVPAVPTGSCAVKSSVRKVTRRSGGNDVGGEDGGNESDSSLDLHTPLPQLMLRHGMLSPHSKLLPRAEADGTRLSIMSNMTSSSHASNASNLSLMSATSSKHPKDARDTVQRRHRHRDGKLLKGGVGLTTGLGWSDSEDEDAPSQLTRRVSTLVLSRRASSSSVASYRSAHSQPSSSLPISRSVSHSVLRQVDEYEDEHDVDELGHSHSSLASRSLPSRSKPVSRVGSGRSTSSSFGRYSTHSTSSAASYRTRAGSASDSSTHAFHTDGVTLSDGQLGPMPGIREQDDGVTPTRAAFERTSNGSLNGGSGPDPHTPSSTASSASMSFPATPESCEENPPLHPVFNQDKVLPPLPPGARPKYPSNLSLRSPSGLQRPRTFSNASSASNNSMLGVPSADGRRKTASPTSTPRQALAERPPKASIPVGSTRPNGIPRPTLTIPKSPLPPSSATSALLRSTTSLSASSANPSQGYTPRPLRLASRSSSLPSPSSTANFTPHPPSSQLEQNQTVNMPLQPGEQPPRPGQVLAYNRNVHDQLKLRALSLNITANRPPGPVVSPGGAQTLVAPSPAVGSSPNSDQSTPVTAQSQSPLPSPSPGLGGGTRPRPRTGTGMTYRNNLSVGSVAASRTRVPTTVSR